jgi:hypothetical protein
MKPPTTSARDRRVAILKGGARKTRRLFAEGLQAQVFETGDEIQFLDWSLRVAEPKTGRLNFGAFPFQPAMYRAMGDKTRRQVVVRKATQVGVSAMSVRWALYMSDLHRLTILYVFPTLGDVHDFSDARVGPMIEGNDYLWERIGEPYNKGLKRVGLGLVYFRGSENKRGLDSVDADGLALDEYDTLNQANIPDAERRLSGVLSAGLIRRVGVPSIPDFGIAEKYDQSDRSKWLVKCSCQHLGMDFETKEPLIVPRGRGWQEINFWENLDQQHAAIVCANCREALDVSAGQWVQQNPDSDVPGFHVSRLIVPNLRLQDVIDASKKMSAYEQEVFHNKDLGLPFAAKDARLSADEVRAAQRADIKLVTGYGGTNVVTMGIDVASERALNVRISEHLDEETKLALWIGEVEDTPDGFSAFDNLGLLMERFHVNMACIDHLPETRLGRAFIERFAGRVYFASYATNQKDPLVVDDNMRVASVRRTIALDATVEMVRRQRNLLPAVLPEGYLSHMTSNIRKVTRTEDDVVKVVWVATRPDDYFQAEVYDLLATELFYRRVLLDDAERDVLTPLDDMLAFKRSEIADYDEAEPWQPGPDDGAGDSMYDHAV